MAAISSIYDQLRRAKTTADSLMTMQPGNRCSSGKPERQPDHRRGAQPHSEPLSQKARDFILIQDDVPDALSRRSKPTGRGRCNSTTREKGRC